MKEFRGYVYGWYNKVNNKWYIGSSRNIKARYLAHLKVLKEGTHWNKHLLSAWKKYGEESFDFIILEQYIDVKELHIREQYHMDGKKSYLPEYGYNATRHALPGVDNRGRKLPPQSEETKEKRRRSLIGKNKGKKYKHTLEQNRQKSLRQLGKKKNKYKSWSEEDKLDHSKAMVEGYKNGTLKSWNKGLTKETDERVMNQSHTLSRTIEENKTKVKEEVLYGSI